MLVLVTARGGPGDLPPLRPPPEQVRRKADEILARPEFRPPPRGIFERILDWIFDQLGRFFDAIGEGGGSAGAWVAVAVLAVVVAVVLWRAWRALRREPSVGDGLVVDGPRRPAADWRAEAATHEAGGRWRDAVRCHWRALVADLAARGLVEEVPGRTTGEYRAQVARSLPADEGSFAMATALFEEAWYARVEVGPGENEREKDLGKKVLEGAGR